MAPMERSIMRHFSVVMGFLCLLPLSGCGFTAWENVPNDLRLSRLSLHEGSFNVKGGDGQTIDVDLVTDFNYTAYATKERFHLISSSAYFCDNEEKEHKEIISGIVYVGKNDFYMPLWWRDEYINTLSKELPPYHYHIDIFGRQYSDRFANHEHAIYPHEAMDPPRDVCIKLEAFHYYSVISKAESNIVRIPKEEFIKLFTAEAEKSKEK